LIETYLLRMSWSKLVLCPICHTNQRGDLEEQNNQLMVSKAAYKSNCLSGVTFLVSMFSDISLWTFSLIALKTGFVHIQQLTNWNTSFTGYSGNPPPPPQGEFQWVLLYGESQVPYNNFISRQWVIKLLWSAYIWNAFVVFISDGTNIV